jgi:hypothetical protein
MTNAFGISFGLRLLAPLLLVCLSVNAFPSTALVKPVQHVNSVRNVELQRSHWSLDGEDSVTPFSGRSSPSRSSLNAVQLRSLFGFPTTAISNDVTTTARQSNKRTQVAEVVETALRTVSSSLDVTSKATKKLKTATQAISFLNWSEAVDETLMFVRNYWWLIPSFAALVPLFTTFVLGIGDAAMPHWWPVTPMDHIVKSPDAALVIGFFLGSNIAYFLSGSFLLCQFPFDRVDNTALPLASISNSKNLEGVALLRKIKHRLLATRMVPTRQSWLGLFLLWAGLISTIFHTEQALGSYAISNSLCYLDHAVAGTACFYYFHTCGRPSPRVWALGIAGLIALGVPLPGYAWLHSSWHFLSAAAATLWALESFGTRASSSSNMVEAISVDDATNATE